jgi:DNA-binding NtrC family response regulator
MRLLIIGLMNTHMTTAGKMALARGAQVSHVETIEAALGALRGGNGADLILIDVNLPIGDLIHHLQQERFTVPVVAGGINVDPASAVSAIQAGASEYIPLPPDPEMISAILESVTCLDQSLLYQDPCMEQVLKVADQIAPSEASVLITGESGTGKEVMARYLHQKSKRGKQKFISVNCAAIPENLLESELFGHEKGSFTGAIARRMGKFEEAHGGTLLLDEISEMHPRLQAKLLRAIQEREIDRVGGSKPIKINIRLIATSNRDLPSEVKSGNFREDLFFRLNVVNLRLPSLRERPQDIPILADHFAKKYSKLNQVTPRPLSDALMKCLLTHPWPGNVRELENAMHRAVLMATGSEIEKEALLMPSFSPPQEGTFKDLSHEEKAPAPLSIEQRISDFIGRTVSDVEQDLIMGTLNYCLGNRTHAATILGISIRTLRNKLRQYQTETS